MQWKSPEPVDRAVFSPSGKLLATTRYAGGSGDPDVLRLWDTTTGSEVAHLSGLSQVFALAFAGERSLFVVEHNRCLFWDGQKARVFLKDGWHASGTATPDGSLAMVARENDIAVLNLPTGKIRRYLTLPAKTQPWYDNKMAAVGPYLAAVCTSDSYECFGYTVLWDVLNGRKLRTYDTTARWEYGSVSIHPTGETLAIWGDDIITTYGRDDEEPLEKFKPVKFAAGGVRYSPDGKSLFALSNKQLIRVRAATGKILAKWGVPKVPNWPDGAKETRTSAIDPVSGQVAFAVDQHIMIWKPGKGQKKR